LDQIEPLFEFPQTRRVQIDAIRVMRKFPLQFMQQLNRLPVEWKQSLCADIYPLQFLQGASDGASLG